MKVAVEVVVMEGGEMAAQTQRHQEPGKLIRELSRGTIGHNPGRIKLEREKEKREEAS